MFFIRTIYDTATTTKVLNLEANNIASGFRVTNGTIRCNMLDLSTIMVEVFDNKDFSYEWYYVLDLLKLMGEYNLDVDGLEIEYYANAKVKSLRVSDSIMKIHISGNICANKESQMMIAKLKLLGVSISNRCELHGISDVFVQDDIITIPEGVTKIIVPNGDYCSNKNIKMIFLPSTLDYTDLNSLYSISCYISNLDKSKITVIFKTNLVVGYSLLSILRCNIHVSGSLKFDMDSFKRNILNSNYDYVFKVSSSDVEYIIDFHRKSIFKNYK